MVICFLYWYALRLSGSCAMLCFKPANKWIISSWSAYKRKTKIAFLTWISGFATITRHIEFTKGDWHNSLSPCQKVQRSMRSWTANQRPPTRAQAGKNEHRVQAPKKLRDRCSLSRKPFGRLFKTYSETDRTEEREVSAFAFAVLA